MRQPGNPTRDSQLAEPQGHAMHEPWHIKREIQLGHILTTLTVAVSALVYVGKLEQRIALIEQQMSLQHERDDRQDKAAGDALGALAQQLARIDAKLDRIIEARNGGKP